MMDYDGFWAGFVVLFGLLPLGIGACVAAFWARRRGARGARLVLAAFLGGVGLVLCVLLGAVLVFRA